MVTNTELTSLAVRKEWSDGAGKHGSDEITVVLHRSTDLAVVPVVTTIGSSTSSTTSSTTTTTTEETTTTTTTIAPIHREVTYAVIDGDFSDGSSGWQSYNIPSDFDGKALSNISTYFRDTLSNYPDYRTHSNIYVTGVEDVCAYSTDGRIAIRSYTDNPTGAVAAGWKTAHASEIEKFVVNFTDGSTFTIINSNYVATAPTVVTETATLAMATDQWQSVNIPSSLQSKEVSKLEAVFKDTLSSFPDYQTDSNFGLKINGSDITSNVVQSVSGKSAIKTYPSNTLADEVAVWSKNPEDIEKFIVTYTDGSTLTITNSNYPSSSGGEDAISVLKSDYSTYTSTNPIVLSDNEKAKSITIKGILESEHRLNQNKKEAQKNLAYSQLELELCSELKKLREDYLIKKEEKENVYINFKKMVDEVEKIKLELQIMNSREFNDKFIEQKKKKIEKCNEEISKEIKCIKNENIKYQYSFKKIK